MRVLLISIVALSAQPHFSLAVAQDRGSTDSIVLDPVLIAFYEIAPRKLAASMTRAVVAECARDDESIDPRIVKVRQWLCDGSDDTFLRSVDGQGRGMMMGYVCEGVWDSKYYATTVLMNAEKNAECVALSYSGDKKIHMLELPKAH